MKTEKRKIYLHTHLTNHYNHPSGIITFYLLPTIEISKDEILNEDGDCSFDIIFGWLFWTFAIIVSWYRKE